MYPKYTLYPNGAFMLCESMSEIDGNVQPPAPSAESRQACTDCDPVWSVISELRGVYAQHIQPLTLLGSPESFDDAIKLVDTVRVAATTSMNALRKTIGKQEGIIRAFEYFGSPGEDAFKSNKGLFMKNVAKVHQQGVEDTTYMSPTIQALSDEWDVRRMVQAFLEMPELYDTLMLGASISAISGGSTRFGKTFDGYIDLCRCVFEDSDRMTRLETTEPHKIYFDDYLANDFYDARDPQNSMEAATRKFFTTASMRLRNTCQTCYELYCGLSDGQFDTTSDCVYKILSPHIVRWVQIFGLGLTIAMANAYRLRSKAARDAALIAYTDQLVNILKTVNP